MSLDNVNESQRITLKSNNGKNTYALNINVIGYIDGNATMHLLLNNKPYKIKKAEGNVDITWSGDWYSNEAVFVYNTENVTKGSLQIKYGFETL